MLAIGARGRGVRDSFWKFLPSSWLVLLCWPYWRSSRSRQSLVERPHSLLRSENQRALAHSARGVVSVEQRHAGLADSTFSASHAARCVACHGVCSHSVPVALVGECSMRVAWKVLQPRMECSCPARATNQSTTRVTRCMRAGDSVMPRDFAALRLITNSNVVGCSTGSSAGFTPLRGACPRTLSSAERGQPD